MTVELLVGPVEEVLDDRLPALQSVQAPGSPGESLLTEVGVDGVERGDALQSGIGDPGGGPLGVEDFPKGM